MPDAHDLQVLIMLTLIPTTIAGMYALVQVSEDIRVRLQRPHEPRSRPLLKR